MLDVLYPISLDRTRNPISSKLRQIVRHAGDSSIAFHSFSNPEHPEDAQLAREVWAWPNLERAGYHQLLTRRYDVVHQGTGTSSNVAATLASKLRSAGRIRHVFTVSVQPSEHDHHIRQLLYSARHADVVVANSRAVADDMRTVHGIEVDHVIRNGVDAEFFCADSADRGTLDELGVEPPYFLFSSALVGRKRPEVFLEIARRRPNARFVAFGRGGPLESLMVDLPPNVAWLGMLPKSKARDLLAFARALVFPSEREGLPNAVLEAMAVGIPVLVQNRSSMPELIRDGFNGWVFGSTDADAWAERLDAIARWDDATVAEFRARARQHAKETYSWQEYARSHVELYRSLFD